MMALAFQDPPGNPCQQGGAKSSENAQTAGQRFMIIHVKNYSTSSQGQCYMSFSMLSTLSKPSLLQKFQLAWPWPFPNLHLHLLPKSLPFWLGGYCRNSSDFNVMKACKCKWTQWTPGLCLTAARAASSFLQVLLLPLPAVRL